MATQREESPILRNDHGWINGGRLYSIPHMYDHFYKVLWRLLIDVDPDRGVINGNGTKENGKDKAKKPKKPGLAVAFAGCHPGEGASTMAFNFASAFAANSSRSVVLVDANLRDPVLHHQFYMKKSKGLADIAFGRTDIDELVNEVIPKKYYFIGAGQRVSNPVNLYESAKFHATVDKLRERFDLMIFDSACLIGHPEAALLANCMDGVIMVLHAEKTRWEVARSAQNDLKSANVRVFGAILNKKQFLIPEFIYRLL